MVLHVIGNIACYFAAAIGFPASSTVAAGTVLDSADPDTGLVPAGQVLELFQVSLVHVIGLPSDRSIVSINLRLIDFNQVEPVQILTILVLAI